MNQCESLQKDVRRIRFKSVLHLYFGINSFLIFSLIRYCICCNQFPQAQELLFITANAKPFLKIAILMQPQSWVFCFLIFNVRRGKDCSTAFTGFNHFQIFLRFLPLICPFNDWAPCSGKTEAQNIKCNFNYFPNHFNIIILFSCSLP